jgi:hypothetical protein
VNVDDRMQSRNNLCLLADMKSSPRGRSEPPFRSSRIEATLLTSHHLCYTHTNSCRTLPTQAISRSLLEKSGGKKQDTCYASGSSHKHGTYLIASDTAASTPITLGLGRTEWCACPCAVRCTTSSVLSLSRDSTACRCVGALLSGCATLITVAPHVAVCKHQITIDSSRPSSKQNLIHYIGNTHDRTTWAREKRRNARGGS